MGHLIRSQRGQSLVEFAIALPLLLALLCGIVDFGWIYSNQYKVQEGSYEAARYASLSSGKVSTEAISTRAAKAMDVNASDICATVSYTADDVTVTVTYDVPTLTFVANALFGNTYHASASNVVAL